MNTQDRIKICYCSLRIRIPRGNLNWKFETIMNLIKYEKKTHFFWKSGSCFRVHSSKITQYITILIDSMVKSSLSGSFTRIHMLLLVVRSKSKLPLQNSCLCVHDHKTDISNLINTIENVNLHEDVSNSSRKLFNI